MSDDFDLEGGRTYYFDDEFKSMLFNYMTKTLKWDKEKFKSIIWNSLSFNEDLEDMYDEVSTIPKEITVIENKKKEWRKNIYNIYYYIEDGIEYQIIEQDGYWHLQAKRLSDGKYISLDTKFESFEDAEKASIQIKLILNRRG